MRVLVVEDEFLLAAELARELADAGCIVVGPFASLEAATRAALRGAFDVALLDVNLNGAAVYPLADDLVARGLPVVFLSGYPPSDLPVRFRATPHLAKPHDPEALIATLRAAAGGGE